MNLSGQVGEVGITLQVTRAATGKVEEVQLVGFVDEDQLKQFIETQETKEQ